MGDVTFPAFYKAGPMTPEARLDLFPRLRFAAVRSRFGIHRRYESGAAKTFARVITIYYLINTCELR